MMKNTYLFSYLYPLLFLLNFINVGSGQTPADEMDQLISTYADYGKFNGSVLVAEKGKVIYKKGFGLANMEWDIPNESNTKYRLASVSKQFTAMLTMQLVAENKLDLKKPISTYLPDYPKETGDIVTLHHLLSHTSGIPNYTSFSNYKDIMRDYIRPEEIVKIFVDSTLKFTPGERFSYSNSGYALLGVIIEKITGKTFEEVLKEKILQPLGMNDTGYDNHRTILKNRATGYDKSGRNFNNASHIDMSLAYTAGGIYSTVEDMYLWDQALYTEKLLPKKYLDMMFETHISAWDGHYGYGWMLADIRIGNTRGKTKTINHDGTVNGFNTIIIRIPSTLSTIILLNNTGYAPLREMADAINGILHKKPYDMPKKSIANSLQNEIEKNGLEKGLAYYKTIEKSDDYYFAPHEINVLGYDFLQAGKIKEAATIFKLNITAFPTDFNVYDSYGEVLLVQGDTTAAIKNYIRSIELNPRNEHGIKVLKELDENIVIPKKEDFYLLDTDWGVEIFHFPIHFAPEIKYKGYEDARFPRGWAKKDQPDFWTYAYAWRIDEDKVQTNKELEANLSLYFDGLMEGKNKDVTPPKTTINLKKIANSKSVIKHIGQLTIFDAFITQKPLILNVTAEQYLCKEKDKSVILFRFSPKEFEHEIWQELEKVKLLKGVCEH